MPNNTASRSEPAHRAIDACWNRIGVYGDASCPQLMPHVHCRNCPVFSAAAAELLDSELPPDHLSEWTTHFSRTKEIEHHDTQSVLVFRIGAEWLALSTPLFKEVAELRVIHSLPHRRCASVLGVANVRGELLICVSLGATLGVEPISGQNQDERRLRRRRFLVVSRDEQRLVFPVDEVSGTLRFRTQELTAVPETVSKAAATYIKAILPWDKKSVGLIDDQLLFYTLNRSLE